MKTAASYVEHGLECERRQLKYDTDRETELKTDLKEVRKSIKDRRSVIAQLEGALVRKRL